MQKLSPLDKRIEVIREWLFNVGTEEKSNQNRTIDAFCKHYKFKIDPKWHQQRIVRQKYNFAFNNWKKFVTYVKAEKIIQDTRSKQAKDPNDTTVDELVNSLISI